MKKSYSKTEFFTTCDYIMHTKKFEPHDVQANR